MAKVAMSRVTKLTRVLAERLNFFAKNRRAEKKGECPKPSDKKSTDLERLRFKKWAFNVSGYNKFGLYTDDLISHTKPNVAKALTRLPGDVLDARNFRLIRAMQVDFLKIHLPEEEWVTFEEDRANRYLTPYIEEIEAEKREIREFGCVNYRHDE